MALLVSLLGGVGAAGLVVGPEELAARASGPAAGPVFLVLYALGTVAFVPKPALSAAAGALFGVGYGLPLTTLGTVAGALLGFWAGRLLGRDALGPLLRARRVAELERRLTERAFVSVLVARLIPVVPFALVNLGAAFSRMGWGPFAGATALGTAPGNAVWVLAGAWAATPSAGWLWLPAGCGALLLAGGALARRRYAPARGSARRETARNAAGNATREATRNAAEKTRRPALQDSSATADGPGAGLSGTRG
ncbi:Uncharacterized membrane protein YdjX, TVP38/TMEM64 family, SNARE-associated domain [Streptomyces zhaozhouensis]|uniref:TVP38/TMEM64 family membrane protein n=1 Tax=Streptomyces zhaozhouensis TaxID=1300267 RepID=A0A286DWV7_9ACTN|nr:Uncharacterized membrane protein YdjX, TVP38/TMEM64 family, SNARE-associated domain [Streptomyces zhaozhouensis]